ncbi:unnamed protein product, partial [Meganyctiphanes norvegica]
EFDIAANQCIVYSFGINNEWSFDDAMGQFGCQVYAFDPTMGKKTHTRGKNIHFYNIGISDKDGKVRIGKKTCEVKRFTSIMKMLGHLDSDVMINYLKVDVEGAEIQMLEDILENAPGILKRIKQIGMEIHMGPYSPENIKVFQKHYELFMKLERHGFRLFYSALNVLPFTKYFHNDIGRTVGKYYEVVWGRWPEL